jgi:Skp family chaperone for outer membrane proteins
MKTITKSLLLLTLLLSSASLYAQRGVRVGFVDLDYVLTKVPSYDIAQKNLDAKVELWKQEIAAREQAIDVLKNALEVERVLLTEELIKDREIEINAATKELLQYKQQRFGPTGDLMFQQKAIMQPIQDELFLIIKKIGEEKKFDFIFQKSDEANLLYSQKRYDLSDMILDEFAKVERKSNYEKSDKEINSKEEEESDINPNEAVEEREDQKKEIADQRAQLLEEKKKKQQEAREQRQADYEARKKALLDARNKKKSETDTTADKKDESTSKKDISESTSDVKSETSSKTTSDKVDTSKKEQEVKKDSTVSKSESTTKAKMDARAKRKAEYEARKKKLMEARKKAAQKNKDSIS